MQINGNTILITGGGSGIGRALAEAFDAEGNQVVIAGRRKELLDQTTAANPGMKSAILDIEDSLSIKTVADQIKTAHPSLNIVHRHFVVPARNTRIDQLVHGFQRDRSCSDPNPALT